MMNDNLAVVAFEDYLYPGIPRAAFLDDISTYAIGFRFSDDRRRVVLLRKQKPAWLKGKLAGPGGRVMSGDTPYGAIRREFRRECGAAVDDWNQIAVLRGSNWIIHFFTSFGTLEGIESMTNEKVTIRDVNLVLQDPTLVSYLKVVIPLCLDESGISKPVEMFDES